MSLTIGSSSAEKHLTRQGVIAAARAVGAASVTWNANSLQADLARLSTWQSLGFHGEMQYMGRSLTGNPAALLSPRQSGEVSERPATVISLAFPYRGGSSLVSLRGRTAPDRGARGYGRVARYATGPDYHRVLPRLLEGFVSALRNLPGGENQLYRVVTDAVPTLERAWAREGGLGFQGKNTMLIRPKEGSFFFLAEVLTSAAIEPSESDALPQVQQSCGTCSRCAEACPTAALQTPYRLDARRCISYLTIEKRGILAEWERRALGCWVFGCDECQECCPFNHHPAETIPEFSVRKVEELVSLQTILSLKDDATFMNFCGGTPLERTRRAGLVRNGICVAVNQELHELFPNILALAASDRSPTVRATALWGAASLISSRAERALIDARLQVSMSDSDEGVRSEGLRVAAMPLAY